MWHRYRLPDDELRTEYERYTQLYLDERTRAPVRGMAEMTLIKMGEISPRSPLDLPRSPPICRCAAWRR